MAFQSQYRASQGLRDLQAALAPQVHLVFLDPKENAMIRAFLDQMVNQEFQESDFLGLLDPRETVDFQDQEDPLVVLETWENQGFLGPQEPQEPRENLDWPWLENQEYQVFRGKEVVLGKRETLDSQDFLVALEIQAPEDWMGHKEIQGTLDHLEKKALQESAKKGHRDLQDIQA